MSTTLSGFVRVTCGDAWHGQIGVITSTRAQAERGHYWVRFGNGKPLAFDAHELEQLDTTQAQERLQEQAHG